MKRRAPCTRCGKDAAFSEEQIARCRAKSAWIEFPPFPANICVRCAMQDPAIRADVETWQARTNAKLVASLRRGIARPLEIIDEFVDKLK